MANLFGEPPIPAEELSEDLKQLAPVRARSINPAENDSVWTQAVRDILYEIGYKRGYEAVCIREDKSCAELLWDEVWFPKEGDQHIVFAMECEWGDAKAVRYDFRKLLYVKAPLKMLVYTAKNDSMRARMHEQIKDALIHYPHHVEGECYVFVEFAPQNRCFRYKFPIAKTGRLTGTPEFVPLDEESRNALGQRAA